MNLANYFWYFTGVLTPRFCDDVIKYALSKEESMARTGGFDKKELSKEDVKNIQRKRKSDLVGYIKKFILMFIWQIKMLVGILNGVDQNRVNLLNINIINIMIGILILGIDLICVQIKTIRIMVRSESCR